jgi:hypothetical protein
MLTAMLVQTQVFLTVAFFRLSTVCQFTKRYFRGELNFKNSRQSQVFALADMSI